MQSVDLTHARYTHLINIGIPITQDNVRILFINEKQFIKQYGGSKQELLEKYNYKKDIEEKKK